MGEKKKGHRKLCASTAVFWETTRMWEKSTWKIAFSSLILPWVGWIWASSRAKVAFLWVAWYCAWAEIPFLWLVCGQHFAEQSHVAVYVKESWVVAGNYRWIYWDFLLRVSSYMVADARNWKYDSWRLFYQVISAALSGSCVCESRSLVEFCALLLRDSICFNMFHASSADAQKLCWAVLHALIVSSSFVDVITPKGYVFP